MHVAQGGERVIDGGWERMLRREAVVDGDDDDPGVVGEDLADIVVRVEVAEDEAAAVVVEEGGRRGGDVARAVDPEPEGAAGAVEGAVFGVDVGRRRGGERGGLHPEVGARLGERELV